MRFLRLALDILFPPRDTESLVRDATLSELGRFVHPQMLADGRVSLMPYRTPLARALIQEAKFRGNERAAALLGNVLREYLRSWLEEHEPFEARSVILVPLPLSKERLKERGYNQSERIAVHALSKLPEVRLEALLMRTRDTLPQTSLPRRERLRNMEAAFSAALPLSGAHTYIVFDDVSTTGATLAAATEALSRAGAKEVLPLSLAH